VTLSLSPHGRTWAVTLLFAVMTAFLTWPQALKISTHAWGHHDVYFNMWRLAWVAHALTTSPSRLFDGNIFYPEPRAMTYSDAMIVEGLFGTPLLMAGLPPVFVHNLLLLGAIVSSATGIFVLARHLTGSTSAGVAAGVIFAFVPYRFEHFMHMELQWTVWIPWAFWAVHRTLETGERRYGLLTGLFVSLQMLSSIYYGVFLVLLLGLVSGLLVLMRLRETRERLVKPVTSLIIGAVVAIVLCGAYAQPYVATKKEVGGRDEREIMLYSARPSSYLVATPENILYGKAFAGRGRPERRLFPGGLAVALAIVGLLSRPLSLVAIPYLMGLVAAYELSLGFGGYTYRFLFNHVTFVEGFRALARLGIFVVFFLAVLAAYGYAALAAGRGIHFRRVLFGVVLLVLTLEYRVRPLNLVAFPNHPPPLQAWLAQQPLGVVADLPMPDPLPGDDPRAAYLSTFHWFPTVNGYSGFVPRSYLDRLDAVRNFPDDRAIARLRYDNVRYVVVHPSRYPKDVAILVLESLKTRHWLRELGRFSDGYEDTIVFFLQ
jgi:hypothetical protein